MDSVFVNLPLRYVQQDPLYLEFFLKRRLRPELGLDVIVMDAQPILWHREIADRLGAAGLACSFHLPFYDLQPGSVDDFILKATRQRLAAAAEIAQIYRPRHLVAHAGFNSLYVPFYPEWLRRSRETWNQFLDFWPDHPPLFLENVYDQKTEPLINLVKELSHRDTGICFDTGHWHSYSGGYQDNNLSGWLETLAPFLGHLHLHDNDGHADQHLGLGQGDIPWEEFFFTLSGLDLHPTITLEPHRIEDLECSLDFIASHPEWFR